MIGRHFPELAKRDQPYLALLEAVIARQAELVARWMLVGFIHGVMNTDNMTISGETIDYGPCAFMDEYDPAAVFSSIDPQGRYAFANQPRIAVWNLTRLAETLLPLLHEDEDEAIRRAEGALRTFQSLHDATLHRGLRRKFGLFTEEESDLALASDLLARMARTAPTSLWPSEAWPMRSTGKPATARRACSSPIQGRSTSGPASGGNGSPGNPIVPRAGRTCFRPTPNTFLETIASRRSSRQRSKRRILARSRNS